MNEERGAREASIVDETRLPRSIGGLFRLAFASYAEHAGFYLLLALAAFSAAAIAEWTLPAVPLTSPHGQFKVFVIDFTSLFAMAYIIAGVALGVGARVAGTASTTRSIAGAATERWLRIISVTLFSSLLAGSTSAFSGLQGLSDPPLLALIAMPFTWLLWGMLGLAAPIAALSADPSGLAIVAGYGRAFALSLQRVNIGRLCIVAAITMSVPLLEKFAMDQFVLHHVARPLFWANVPFDALTAGPLAALQTVFALDFARRAGALGTPKP